VTARHPTFFFSSRRRHTRSKRDWSSDVCSSDLVTVLRGLDGLVGVRLALLAAQARGDGPCRTEEVVGGDGAAELLSDQRDLLRGVDLVVVVLSGGLGALGTVGALVLGAVVLGVAGLTGVRGGLGGLGGGTGVGRGVRGVLGGGDACTGKGERGSGADDHDGLLHG